MALVRRLFADISFVTLTDRLWQIPGLPEILASLTPQSHPGLLGICLSGAGPTILALATDNFDVRIPRFLHRVCTMGADCSCSLQGIAAGIKKIFKEHGVDVDWELLTIDERGAWTEELKA